LLTTSEVAELLAMSPEWVREHAAELRAIRIGGGPRGELRFALRDVTDALERRRLRTAPAAAPRKRPTRRRQRGTDVELIELPPWAA
jgi:hypothetical protein